ncbi:MAG TPA: Hsp70 family protein, partial [Candidatus Hydrogenedentes bacterium]|nr:Hsp70 family protein [Candidatus Hydrogenedentota bacterium]
VTIHVLQGERELAAHNRTLGRFDLIGIPSAPRGIPQIEVTFDIDANGIVHVSAKDLGTGKEQKIRIESSSGLSDTDIESMLKDAEAHAKEDAEKKQGIEVRNNADSLLYSTEKTLKENADKIGGEDKEAIESALGELRTALSGEDLGAIEAGMQKVTQASHKMAEAMYASAAAAAQQAEAGANPAANTEGDAAPADGSVDADFTVVDDEEKK